MTVTWTYHTSSLLIGAFSPNTHGTAEKDGSPGSVAKIAAFDLDGTLITTKSVEVHARNANDWRWEYPDIPSKIKETHEKGFDIKIITNQGRLTDAQGKEAPEAELFRRKMEHVLSFLNVPLVLYAACANDKWRKPRTGIWDLFTAEYRQQGRDIDKKSSFLVGDAAGRSRDHSDADFHYSVNLDIGFQTPETYFLEILDEKAGHKFDPASYLRNQSSWTDLDLSSTYQNNNMIILIGAPGSGKSYFTRKILQPLGYYAVSLHDADSLEKKIQKAENLLTNGQKLVIDSVNVDHERRQVWLLLAKKHSVNVTAIHFKISRDLCLHNDTVRALGGKLMNPEDRGIFPRMPFLKLFDGIEPPKLSEGFNKVIDLHFQTESVKYGDVTGFDRNLLGGIKITETF